MSKEEFEKHAAARGWDEHLSGKVLGVMDRHGITDPDLARTAIADAAILRVVHSVRDEGEAERQAAERALSGQLKPLHASEKPDLSKGALPRHSSEHENAGGAVSIEAAYAHRQAQLGGGAGAPSPAQSQAADPYAHRAQFFGGTA